MRGKRNFLPVQNHIPFCTLPGCEIAGLIEFIIIGDGNLGHQTQNTAPVHSRGHIVKFTAILQGKPHENQRVHIPSLTGNPQKLLLRLQKKRLLPEQIPAGIRRNAKLRQHYNLGPRLAHLLNQLDDSVCIVYAVRHFQVRCSGPDFDKSLLHFLPPKRTAVLCRWHLCSCRPHSQSGLSLPGTLPKQLFQFSRCENIMAAAEMTVDLNLLILLDHILKLFPPHTD